MRPRYNKETGELKFPYIDKQGREVLDPVPMAPPVDLKAPSELDRVRRLIREELSRKAEEHGEETFEEADDFEVGDDYDPTSPYEYEFEPPARVPQPDPTLGDRPPSGQATTPGGDPPSDGPRSPVNGTATTASPGTQERVSASPGSPSAS